MWFIVIAALMGAVFGVGAALSPGLAIAVGAVVVAAAIGFVIGSDRARRLIERALEEHE
jgi:Flp pilus assembly protein TadB